MPVSSSASSLALENKSWFNGTQLACCCSLHAHFLLRFVPCGGPRWGNYSSPLCSQLKWLNTHAVLHGIHLPPPNCNCCAGLLHVMSKVWAVYLVSEIRGKLPVKSQTTLSNYRHQPAVLHTLVVSHGLPLLDRLGHPIRWTMSCWRTASCNPEWASIIVLWSFQLCSLLIAKWWNA